MASTNIGYDNLPQEVKDNLSPEQWELALQDVLEGEAIIPDTGYYINIKNGQIHRYEKGERITGPLLPVHDLSGANGKDDSQFHTAPAGAHHQ